MKLFTSRDVKLAFIITTGILLCFIITGQLIAGRISEEYKSRMIEHDYETAGFLYNSTPGAMQTDITRAFTKEKSEKDYAAGEKILRAVGYQSSIDRSLIPDVGSFHQKYSVLVLILSVSLSAAILTVLIIFTGRQEGKFEKACKGIAAFMDGDTAVRLDDSSEGNLSKLFSSINAMSTALTAHTEKEKQVKEFLRDTISDISHQLKTPLAALQMYNEIIRDEKAGNDVIDKFSFKSENELIRMETLIQSLLKLARLDADSIVLEKSEQNLRDFMEQAIALFRTRAEQESKSITLNCGNDINLNCDRDWLLEAVSNIIKNALDHTGIGGRVDITCSDSPVVTRIMIKDNGKGIHPEDIHHIFKRFYRSRFSKDKQGTGIGLTLSKGIMEKHGGSVTVESELDKGTTFQLLFPKLTNM